MVNKVIGLAAVTSGYTRSRKSSCYAAQANARIDAEMVEKSGFCFFTWKPAVFRQVKVIKPLRGGVALYAAQVNAQIDAEMAEKSGFQTETSYCYSAW